MQQRPHFLSDPEETPAAKELFDEDVDDLGYVMNASRLWAYAPEAKEDLFEALDTVTASGGLSFRQRGVLVSATASTMGDSYCSLAWGSRLAGVADPDTAAGVLAGDDTHLAPEEAAMARWARKVAADPNGTSQEDVDELRQAGFDDRQIFAITAYVAFRIAFSAVNDALGARPDAAYATTAPDQVRRVVTFGRPMEEADQPV